MQELHKDEKLKPAEQIADNLSCSSLDINEYNIKIPVLIKQEIQPIKVLKTPVENKIDFRLTSFYSQYKQYK